MNRIPPALHPTIRALYISEEMTKRAIAERYGTTIGSVKSALRIMGVRLSKQEAADRNRRRMSAMTKPAKPVIVKSAPPYTVMDLVRAAAKVAVVKSDDLLGARRLAKWVRIRAAVYYLAKDHYSLNRIGVIFGGRDHTTIGHSVKRAEARLIDDWRFHALIDMIRNEAVRAKQDQRRAIAAQVERLAA